MSKYILPMTIVLFFTFYCCWPAGAAIVTRGPYLQIGTPTSIVVKWRTDAATDSRVSYGVSLNNLINQVDDTMLIKEHEVQLTGLLANTTYYYAIGSLSEILSGDDAEHFFVTPPNHGTEKPVRIWVLGDSGTADSNARAVRNAYFGFTGNTYTDVWLMLGDNAYDDGTDNDYQNAVFDMYPSLLKQTVLWPTLGNHDGRNADSDTQTGTYYDIFTLPRLGEAGGLASGTEAYYSFNYANIHFICLDSFDSNRSPGSPMLTWLENDLSATNQKWIIAYWHHPPYSKGSHDSDSEIELFEMRKNVLPILESYGVDLVLCGHSHSYERSFLLNGHYGTSNTLNSAMIIDSGDGRTDGDGPYMKDYTGSTYIVAGSSGKASGGSLNHPVMYLSLNHLGSLILDIDADNLDAFFLNDAGSIDDYFTIIKTSSGNQAPRVNAGEDKIVIFPASAILDGTVIDDGLPSPPSLIKITWTQVSGPGTVTFADTAAVDTTASFLQAGSYVLRLTADDQELSTSDEVTITVAEAVTAILEVQVESSSDDAEEKPSGSVNVTSSDLELIYASENQTVGMRFNTVDIPPGATIVDAYIQFQVDETSSEATSLTIQGQAIDDAPTFTTSDYNISTRILTEAAVSWSPVPWTTVGAAGLDQQTPDISSVIQEMADRPGWSSGNSLVLIITGTGKRVAESYNGENDGAPLLHVKYSTAPPVNQPPIVSAGLDQGITLPSDTALLAATVTDDGLRNGGTIITTWSHTGGTGTGTVLFGDTGAVTTSVTFNPPSPGTYVLRLTASDSEFTVFDECTITVSEPVNQPPIVNAGLDQSVLLPTDTALLAATVTDDGLPDGSTVITTWSHTGGTGTGTVLFRDTGAVNTSVTFNPPDPGTYVIRLTASDLELTAFDELIIAVSDEINQPPIVSAGLDQSVLLPTDTALLAATVTDDGLPDGSTVITAWSHTGGTGTGTVFFRDTGAVTTSVTFSPPGPGTYVLRLTAGDSERTAFDECTITVIETVSTEIRVAASSDDAEEQAPSDVNTTSSDLELVEAGSIQIVGMRFNGVIIPQGATIVNAYIQFQVDETNSETTSLSIEGEAIDNAPAFSNSTGNISLRSRTTAAVPWSPAPWPTVGAAGPDQQTPDISSVIQEIVGRLNWSSGNSLAVIITGTGKRVAESYDGSSSGAPLLHAEYSTAPPVNQPPIVDAGADQGITLPTDTAFLAAAVTDDGLSGGSTVTTTWSHNGGTGTGTVLFGDTGAVNTSVTFSPPDSGTYVLRLTASDLELTAFDECTITLSEPVNQPPIVDAGLDQDVFLPTDAAFLAAAVTDDGLPGGSIVTTTWSHTGGTGTGTVLFGDTGAVNTSVTFSPPDPGTYVLRLTANDQEQSTSDEITITVAEAVTAILEVQVESSSDDAEEKPSGSVNVTSSDLELIYASENQTVGMRFNVVDIPPGATIVDAYLQFQVDETNSETTELTIWAEAIDDAPTFSTSSQDITSRTKTTAAVSWSPAAWPTVGEAGLDQQTPNIAPVIQEVVEREGWWSGNSLVIIITGTGKRVAESYDGDNSGAPLLHVAYNPLL